MFNYKKIVMSHYKNAFSMARNRYCKKKIRHLKLIVFLINPIELSDNIPRYISVAIIKYLLLGGVFKLFCIL